VDPDAALATMLELRADIERLDRSGDEPGEYYRIASEQSDCFAALHDWIIRGGFLPAEWSRWWQRAVTPPPGLAPVDMERRAYRLRSALRDAGVPENLVRAIELEDVQQEPGLPQGVYRRGEDL
jgi:hypothetical protein